MAAPVSLLHYAGALGLALVQGALVAAPRRGALAPLERVRSPAWAVVLPGSIVLGTFGPLAAPSSAIWLAAAAALAAPPLAGVAALAVVRGRRAWAVGLAFAATVLAVVAGGPSGELSATVVTVLACLALGAALARLIPAPWILAGVLSMAVVDAGLLACGAGQPAAALIVGGSAPHGEVFDSVRIGQLMVDYPDLVLAATLGAFLADQRGQRRGAVLVAAFATLCFVLTPRGGIWPATVPMALTLLSLRAASLPRFIAKAERTTRSPDPAEA
jgi:hypothetical protein